MDYYQLIAFIITQLLLLIDVILIPIVKSNSKKKKIKEQISCCKKEIWSIQREITSIVVSKDNALLNSSYVQEKIKRLQELKQEIADLNSQLREKDKDTTKLNVTETIKMVKELTSKFKEEK